MSRILNAQTQAWLQVFACAARHLSFTRCAEELHVTPGAISQQMRQLEERLGFKLFHRTPNCAVSMPASSVAWCASGRSLRSWANG